MADKAYQDMTVAELQAERAHWQSRIDAATGWGAGYHAAVKFRNACDTWIARKEKAEVAHGR